MACSHPIRVVINGEPISLPCGRCLSCLKAKRNEWIVRLSEEHKVSKDSYFITLTYSDENIPYTFDQETGEKFNVLCPSDTQLFLKRLRKKLSCYDVKLRYFLLGEYGPTTFRAHYHCLFFFDRVLSVSLLLRLIRESWSLGFVSCSSVTSQRIAYCAKYLNPLDVLPSRYKPFKPFRRMSLGIGKSYITPAKIVYHSSGLLYDRFDLQNYFYFSKDGYKMALPRYYKNRIYTPEQRSYIRYFFASRAFTALQNEMREQQEFTDYLNTLCYERKHQDYSNAIIQRVRESCSFISSEEERLRRYLSSLIKKSKL